MKGYFCVDVRHSVHLLCASNVKKSFLEEKKNREKLHLKKEVISEKKKKLK